MYDSRLENDEWTYESLDDNDDPEFDVSLELAAEVAIHTGCASINEEVSEYLTRGCGCKKHNNGPSSAALSSEEVTSQI